VLEYVDEGRLGALDLRGENRFLPDVHLDEEVRVREELRGGVEAGQPLVGLGQETEERFVVAQRGIVGQPARDEGAKARGLRDVASGASRDDAEVLSWLEGWAEVLTVG
jgi:hypothetical protein